MTFNAALKAAGLKRPGRTTWHGKAADGTPVFTIWADDIHQVNARFFAWWDHVSDRGPHKEPSARWRQRARKFIESAQANLGRDVRAVIIHPRREKPLPRSVASAQYPHPLWATARFRTADVDALHFIVELTP